MKIKLIKGWNGRSPGTILEPQLDGVATTLIRRGLAEEIVDEPEVKQKPKAKLQGWVKKPEAN